MEKKIAVLIALLLGGCITTENQYYGKGPVPTLAPNVAADLKNYFSTKQNIRAFAVTADGQHGGRSYCGSEGTPGSRCYGAEYAAIGSCETVSRGRPCYVLASGNEIVWKDEKGLIPTLSTLVSTAASGGSSHVLGSGEYVYVPTPTTPTQVQRQASSQPTTRSVAINWEGIGGPLAGTAEFVGSMRSGTMKVRLPSDECQGSFSMTGSVGSWAVSCKSGLTASGTASSKGADEFSGSGVDSQKRRVDFALGKGR